MGKSLTLAIWVRAGCAACAARPARRCPWPGAAARPKWPASWCAAAPATAGRSGRCCRRRRCWSARSRPATRPPWCATAPRWPAAPTLRPPPPSKTSTSPTQPHRPSSTPSDPGQCSFRLVFFFRGVWQWRHVSIHFPYQTTCYERAVLYFAKSTRPAISMRTKRHSTRSNERESPWQMNLETRPNVSDGILFFVKIWAIAKSAQHCLYFFCFSFSRISIRFI